MKYILTLFILAHSLIHFTGFAKAWNVGNFAQLTKHISKPIGLAWLFTAILFITAVLLFFLKNDKWWFVGGIAVIISQVLIIIFWKDAKFGSVANIIALAIAFFGYSVQKFENRYIKDVSEQLTRTHNFSIDIFSESDLAHLPAPVQKYLRYVGVVNKPKIKNVKIEFEGQMREKGKNWFPFTSEQYNFFDNYTRLFFMKGKMYGTIVPGYHRYKNKSAAMDIRFLGIFPVVNTSGGDFFQTETVTLFNDMCLFAPATLIDQRITWEALDSLSAKATLHNEGISISAILYFNEQGQLINFISDDRLAVADMKKYRFSTPAAKFKNINDYNLPTYGEGTWHYPEGEFVYGQFNVKNIQYNVTE